MRLERATAATLDEWLALRLELWPHESEAGLAEQARKLLGRESAAAVFLLRDDVGGAIAMAEATVRRDYVNGCSTSPVAFLEGLYVRPAWRRQGARGGSAAPSKPGAGNAAAANSPRTP